MQRLDTIKEAVSNETASFILLDKVGLERKT